MSPVHRPLALGVQVRTPDEASDLFLELADAEVTLAEVFDALGLPAHTAVDGTVFSQPEELFACSVLSGGSLLGPAGTVCAAGGLAQPAAAPMVDVSVVAGPDAGHLAEVPAGTYRLVDGRPAATSEADASERSADWWLQIPATAGRDAVAPWHRQAGSIEVLDEPSGTITIGSSVDPEAGGGRTVQRPPRPIPPSAVAPIPLVEPPPPVREPSPLSWATLLAPVPIAFMMAFFFRPIFALFAAMGPVMALGRWYESRRRHRRDCVARRQVISGLRSDVAAAVAVQREAMAQLRWSSQPHVAELYRRARSGSVRLWERRPGAAGFLDVVVGIGSDRVAPVLADGRVHSELHDDLDKPMALRAVPHVVSPAAGAGLGVHGDRSEVVATARAVLLQLATLHGPADLAIGVLCLPTTAAEWDWLKWLPHHDRSLTAHSATTLATALDQRPRCGRAGNDSSAEHDPVTHLILVDDPAADVALLAAAARRSGVDLRVLSVAADVRSLPAICDTLIGIADARCAITVPKSGWQHDAGSAVGISADTAEQWARSLSGRIDPEHDRRRLDGLGSVGLCELVGYVCADDLVERWRSWTAGAAPAAAVGVGAGGPVTIDLTVDGPHALIAGTTGSGKSELLRTLVLSLAWTCPPSEVNFVLIDFKGGGAFDAVDRLPHIAGVITDLDETLVERALTSLRAELLRRERLFRSLGISTFDEAAGAAPEPIARLVVVIDEFAALAQDHPELMASVIDLASRGRSLGMHVVLATQRPSGVVDQKIRANTNLRIALRVQDAFDSQDVVGVADAAHIDRHRPGRAYFRVGADTPLQVQIASTATGDPANGARCAVRPLGLFTPEPCITEPAAGAASASAPGSGRSQLEVLVDAVVAAGTKLDHGSARPLWSEPLPGSLDWIDLGSRSLNDEAGESSPPPDQVVLGLADVPEQQTHECWRWCPESGPLVVYGASSDCAAKVLLSVGAALRSNASTADVSRSPHLYVIDGGAGALAPLLDLAHVGACVAIDELDRVDRVVSFFEREIGRRVTRTDDSPFLVLMIDNLAAVLGAHNELGAASLVDRLSAVARDGSPRGVHLVLTARTVRDVPHRLAQQLANRLVMALADPGGYLALGLRARQVPELPPMRGIDVVTNRLVQLVEPPTLADWCDTSSAPACLPETIRGFPESVCAAALPGATVADGTLRIPIGVESDELGVAHLGLRAGRHALVIGPQGSGRSTLLDTIVSRFDGTACGVRVVRIGHTAAREVEQLARGDEPALVVVDDADLVSPGIAESLGPLLDLDHVRVVAATSTEAARSLRAWTAPIRAGGVGVLLGRSAADGELLGARAERIPGLGRVPGRGLLVGGGRAVAVQVADANAATDPVWLL